jgi:hypothetical protein
MDEDEELQRLLAFAERIVEAGIEPDLVRVQFAPSNADELMLLDSCDQPEINHVWDSLMDQSADYMELEQSTNQEKESVLVNVTEIQPVESTTMADPIASPVVAPSELPFSGGSSGLRTELMSPFASDVPDDETDDVTSPVRELPPMALFTESQPSLPAGDNRMAMQHENSPDTPARTSNTTHSYKENSTPDGPAISPTAGSAQTRSAALLQSCPSRCTIFKHGKDNELSLNTSTLLPLLVKDVVYYWVTHTHRVTDNLALGLALQLSRELKVPLVALVSALLHASSADNDHLDTFDGATVLYI